MNLATLDRRVGTEGPPNDLAQRLGAVYDEQSADLRVEPALDQIVAQRLHDGGILGRPFDQGAVSPFVLCLGLTPTLCTPGDDISLLISSLIKGAFLFDRHSI